jgi:outer membrane receptor protein involved in Fe transport
MVQRRLPRCLWLAFSCLMWIAGVAEGQTQPSQTPDPVVFTVDVIGATPLPGVDLFLTDIPAPVQTALARDIAASGALDLADFLNRRFAGVHVNEVQGNPFQTDVNYRGYTASPLLGTPQGLSVYMDGMRLNQPFGEVVSWDLIPRQALSSIALMPGSNPLFGLNTLGGALSIRTKDGRSDSGTTAEAVYGSHDRRSIEFEHGGSKGSGLNWYLAGNLFADDGWRNNSPSKVQQVFSNLGWHDAMSDLKVTLAYSDTALTGNGLQDSRFLAKDYASVYTSPDETSNHGGLINVSAKRTPSVKLTMSGNVYYRQLNTNTFNADINESSLDESLYQPNAAERAALAAAGYTGVPASGANASNTPFPFWRCIANALLNDQPALRCNGLLNRTHTGQHNEGASGQLTMVGSPRAGRNQFTAGAAYDHSGVAFQQSTQLGYLNPDRSVSGVNAYGDGATGGTVDGEPYDTRVDLHGAIHTWSGYATDTLSIRDAWRLTVSARYNRTDIRNDDRISPAAGPGSLTGNYVFARLNPAAGLTFSPTKNLNLYAGYSEGSRAPTSIELGCADPNEPCKLPNAMAGDPPLDQVIARTWEAGIRGGLAAASRVNWTLGAFGASNHHDILFVSSPQTGFGYFKNFGETERRGFEAQVNGHAGRAAFGGSYTWLDATYQSSETVSGAGNSTNDLALAGTKGLEGTIQIRPGDRIPMIPEHLMKAFADIKASSKLSFDLDLVGISSSFARGNENNLHQPDGTYYLGPGTAPGYAIVNVGARYQAAGWLQLIAQVNNLFSQHYETAAQLSPSGFTDSGTFVARSLPAVNGQFPVPQSTFYTPGAPVLFWLGTRVKF